MYRFTEFKNKKKFIKNEETIEISNIEKLEKDLINWDMPVINPKKIYNLGSFDLRTAASIKTVEHTIPVNGDRKSIPLLIERDIQRYKNDYHYMHIGLIQVAIKPLHLKGIDCCFLLALRDSRSTDYKESLMGIIESTTSNGPVYCNVFPNLILSLSDDNILDAILMDLDTKGYKFIAGSEIINIAYRIQFKVMNTLSPNAKLVSTKGKTTIVESNLGHTNVACNKLIPWENISFPDIWEQKEAMPPQRISRELEQIEQNTEGDITVRFTSNRFSRIKSIKSMSELSRASTSNIPDKNYFEDTEVEGIKHSKNNIPHGLFRRYQGPPESTPTPSEMDFNI